MKLSIGTCKRSADSSYWYLYNLLWRMICFSKLRQASMQGSNFFPFRCGHQTSLNPHHHAKFVDYSLYWFLNSMHHQKTLCITDLSSFMLASIQVVGTKKKGRLPPYPSPCQKMPAKKSSFSLWFLTALEICFISIQCLNSLGNRLIFFYIIYNFNHA